MMGAKVIKIEAPGAGDLSRRMGNNRALGDKLMGAGYCSTNAGKQSITLNLKHKSGKAAFLRLVETADVMPENFRPGVMRRLELDYERLHVVNPSLIYCSIFGF